MQLVPTTTPRFEPVLKFKRLNPGAKAPIYATDGSGCFDLCASFPDGRTLMYVVPTMPIDIGTGLAFEIPPGFVMLIFSRSGHGFNFDTRLANCVGVIDSDYRGEVRVKLTRDTATRASSLRIQPGDRIAQAMLVPVDRWTLQEVDDLTATERGTGGFGSTGV